MSQNKTRIHTENIYPGELPHLNYKFKDVEIRVDDETVVTGTSVMGAGDGLVLVVKYKHRDHTHVVIIPRGDVNRIAEIIASDRELNELAEQLADELRGVPVEIKVSRSPSAIYVSLLRRADKETFQRYVDVCKRHGMKFDLAGQYWYLTQRR
jgi:hypothetical protein